MDQDGNGTLPLAVQMRSGVSRTNATFSGSPLAPPANLNFGPNWIVLILPYIEQGNLTVRFPPASQTTPRNGR
jgi:hypothetical protein